MTTGLFGKIPSQGDFIRHNVADPIAHALTRWLQEGREALAIGGASDGPQLTKFLFAEPDGAAVAIGAIAPSADQVGRRWPLAVFTVAPAAVLSSAFPTMHVAFDGFLDAAGETVAAAGQLTLPELVSRVQSLPVPQQAHIEHAQQIGQASLENGTAAEFNGRLFAAEPGSEYYAFHTFRTACAAAGPSPSDRPTVLDCPVAVDLDLFVWLDLARRLLAWPVPPSFFWVEEPEPRLLLSLGRAPGQILNFLANPKANSEKLWPLRTTRDAAVAAARDSLPFLEPYAGASTASLGELLTAAQRQG